MGLRAICSFLKKKARIATTTVVKDAHEQQKNVAHKKETHTQAIKDFLKSLDGRVCTHTARCNEKGGLYQALDAARIADIITTETKGKCDPAWIVIDQPIKQSGEHMVTLAYDGMQVVVSIVVESQ
ncbi:MAG: hypothetical protein LRY42_02700 [Candidatus Pacebacteria bacterium]|nr:hypothetical protein [Candidatus Paceibacterota bacterium]